MLKIFFAPFVFYNVLLLNETHITLKKFYTAEKSFVAVDVYAAYADPLKIGVIKSLVYLGYMDSARKNEWVNTTIYKTLIPEKMDPAEQLVLFFTERKTTDAWFLSRPKLIRDNSFKKKWVINVEFYERKEVGFLDF
jgi:hypothetical protein